MTEKEQYKYDPDDPKIMKACLERFRDYLPDDLKDEAPDDAIITMIGEIENLKNQILALEKENEALIESVDEAQTELEETKAELHNHTGVEGWFTNSDCGHPTQCSFQEADVDGGIQCTMCNLEKQILHMDAVLNQVQFASEGWFFSRKATSHYAHKIRRKNLETGNRIKVEMQRKADTGSPNQILDLKDWNLEDEG